MTPDMIPPTAAAQALSNSSRSTIATASVINSQEPSTSPDKIVTQRTINSGAYALSDSASLPENSGATQFTEVFKRRRLGPNSLEQYSTQNGFNSQAVKALFNIEPSTIMGDQIQPNENSSMRASSMAHDPRPDVSRGYNNFLNQNGSVHHTGPGNALPGLGGCYVTSTGRNVAGDLTRTSGSLPSANVSDAPFASQPNGFLIPGLGAPFKPLGLENNNKTPPVVTHSIPAGPHSRVGAAHSRDSGRPQQRGPHNVDLSANQKQQLAKPLDTATIRSADNQSSAPEKDSSVSSNASPEASAAVANKSDAAAPTSDAVRASEYVRPTGPPPVWTEKQTPRTFKLQHQTSRRRHETFEGAYQILSSLNPDHYLMPYGSRVIAIKCNTLDDILLSHQIGLWATNRNVMDRIMELHNSRDDPSMKTLFLWSMPGSKNFCGLAELQAYDADVQTEFWDKDEGKIQGGMIIHWVYNKLVPFEDITPLVEGKIDQASVTQMWNGMNYSEPTGREVIKCYVEAPHIENMLAAPSGEFFQKAMASSRLATAPPMAPRFSGRGNYRGQHFSRGIGNGFRGRGRFETSKIGHGFLPRSAPRPVVRSTESSETTCSTKTNPASPEHYHNRGQPERQVIEVFKYPDGTLTTAPDVNGNTKPITPVKSYASMQDSDAQTSNSLARTQSIQSLKSSNMPPPLLPSATIGSSFPSHEQMLRRKSGSVFNDSHGAKGSVESLSFAMPPPLKSVGPQHGPGPQSETHQPSTPRFELNKDNRFAKNINTWSYSSTKSPTQPKTPLRHSQSSYDLSASPMDTTAHDTLTPRVGRSMSSQNNHDGSPDKAAFGYGQVPKQLRTPDTSPKTASVQPDTPRPRPTLGRNRIKSDASMSGVGLPPDWVDNLVDDK
ncbi:hypothetical protein D6C82_07051 [Aureobasidium pullulans]|nr:hypothetical protein D6C82_07051 [Aureobasidium pullulans]